MRMRWLEIWSQVRSSFWFLPTLMVLSSAGLAFASLHFDRAFASAGATPPAWLTVAGTESARVLLSVIAGSMMTVAGVTFSVVIVALTLASSQYGPRLLVRFMDDTGNQLVLGTFISVFFYSVLVLLHLPGDEAVRPLPLASISIGVALALLAVGVLIYFFHHISTSIRAGNLVYESGRALELSIDTDLPKAEGADRGRWPPRGMPETTAPIRAPRSGYLSAFDLAQLEEIAEREGLRLALLAVTGDLVLEDDELARLWPVTAARDEVQEEIRSAFSIVSTREESEDFFQALEGLTEIAVRGLSPGINDPYTAVAVADRLSIAFDRILDRLPAAESAADGKDLPRVFFRFPDAERLFDLAYGPIRAYGAGDAKVLETMAMSLARINRTHRPHWNELLREQIARVRSAAQSGSLQESDQQRVEEACARALERIPSEDETT